MRGAELDRSTDPVIDRPVSIVDILDGSFALIRHQPRVVLGLTALFVVPLTIVHGAANASDGAASDETDWLIRLFSAGPVGNQVGLVALLLEWAAVSVLGMCMAVVVSDLGEGRQPTIVGALTRVAPRLPHWLLAFVLIRIIEAVGSLLFVIPGVIAMVWLALTSPVLVIEPTHSGPDAMSRSAELVRPRASQVFGLIMLLGIISLPTSLAFEVAPAQAVRSYNEDLVWVLESLGSMVSSMVLMPVVTASMAFMYFDLRYRSEGLDLNRRRQALLDQTTSQSGPVST